ncbi:MAG: metallophosphoesterase family protein [Chloroflexi bacterium]|nr:metallophosphoesterase family protein [Chloroflexota bacterium]
MRVAIISDIHSNLSALNAVLSDADRRGVDELWCLGDIVGYGPEPRECLEIVRRRAGLCLSGNHDMGVVGKVSLAEFNPYAAAANKWTAQVMEEEELAHLGSLPAKLVWEDFTLAHASPREPVWEYVMSPPIARASFAHFETRVCFVGHSHVPLVCPETQDGGNCSLFPLPEESPLPLGAGRTIINPGSVGQPRDGDPRASYAIYDSQEDALYHYRVPYDIASTQDKMRSVGLPGYLIERLSQGH